MNCRKIILSFMVFALCSVLGRAKGIAVSRPYGLMTDLLAHTELTWQNGHLTGHMYKSVLTIRR